MMSDAVLTTLIASAFTFLGVLVTVISSNKSIKNDIKEVKEKTETLHEENKEQSLAILRLTVMNSEMPMSERLIAGNKYIKRGGNGDVKHYYEQLIQEHVK